MKRLLFVALLAVLAWQGYAKYQANRALRASSEPAAESMQPTSNSVQFKCDGRTYCSQMTSCAEATYFLKNCPDVKMDGNHDGVPCEKQWCNK